MARTTRCAYARAMGDARRFAIVLAALVLVAAPARSGASTAHRVVVAWDTPAIQGRVAALDTAPPYAFTTPELAVGADGLVRAAQGRVYHLSRTSGVLTIIDPESWTPVRASRSAPPTSRATLP